MKSEHKILAAFILNLFFSAFEFIGGTVTGSVAIISDALHDIGDAASIGISYFLERKSKKQPDEKYTYGYARYSLLGGAVSSLILFFGSVLVIYNAIVRILNPVTINYNGMILFAIAGTLINTSAAFFTGHGDSLNQKSVNLHMLEDALGWIVVLVGAIVIKLTDFVLIDPVLSIAVAIFILINALKNIKDIVDIFCIKVPQNIDMNEIYEHIKNIHGVTDIHHIHIWTTDGLHNYATMHVVTNADSYEIRQKIRNVLHEHSICHVTLELEKEEDMCTEKICRIEYNNKICHHHHH